MKPLASDWSLTKAAAVASWVPAVAAVTARAIALHFITLIVICSFGF
jgi:hypothetical protein